MCGRAFSPRFLFLWPNARVGVMGGEQAAGVLATVRRHALERAGGSWSAEEEADFKAPLLAKYEAETAATYSTARLWDDGIIVPEDTRDVLGLALAAATEEDEQQLKDPGWGGSSPWGQGHGPANFGVFRM